ncbi:hypothetical protein E2C01_028932 [Portunus trituberculatus]|uniref:Uncharacterized protein n=1 Tax=Portunus trituberculatus TaxID=210409 RepID=A0A5B7EQE5_PORTR|nr:hypothetical protein [Portunus trituberculatus]
MENIVTSMTLKRTIDALMTTVILSYLSHVQTPSITHKEYVKASQAPSSPRKGPQPREGRKKTNTAIAWAAPATQATVNTTMNMAEERDTWMTCVAGREASSAAAISNSHITSRDANTSTGTSGATGTLNQHSVCNDSTSSTFSDTSNVGRYVSLHRAHGIVRIL